MHHDPKVCISVLNWNAPAKTIHCLESLAKLSYLNTDIVVVDNASRDDSAARIRAAYPHVTLIQSAENLGYAGGHRLALDHARQSGADLVWILNNDATVQADTLSHLVDAYQHLGDGLYGSIPLDAATASLIQHTAWAVNDDGEPLFLQREALTWETPCQDWAGDMQPRRVANISGSSFLLPLTLVDRYGFMDESFFLYAEETDYCFRLAQQQIPSYLVPASVIVHELRGSSNTHPMIDAAIQYYKLRNRLRLVRTYLNYRNYYARVLKLYRRYECLRRWIASGFSCARYRRRFPESHFGCRAVWDSLWGRRGKTIDPEDYWDHAEASSKSQSSNIPAANAPLRVSVIIPVYNAAAYVTEAVESALAQSETGEVILVEDGSPDGSLAICETLAAQYARVRLFRHPDGGNHGAGPSRNLGIQHSTCTYIAFLDADDYFLPGRFDTARELFAQDPTIDGVYEAIGAVFENDAARERFFAAGRTSPITTLTRRIAPEELFEALARDAYGQFSGDGLVIRRDLFARTGWFGAHRHEDTAMWLKMAAMGRLVPGKLEEPVAIRRVYEGNRLVERLAITRRARLHVIMWHAVHAWARQHLEQDRQHLVVKAYLRALLRPYHRLPYGVRQIRVLLHLITWTARHPGLLRSRVYRRELWARLVAYSGLRRLLVTLRLRRDEVAGGKAT